MRLPVITAILASAALIAAPAALADGDPASDVLAGRALFNPVDSGISPASQARLDALLKASAHAGFPIRVALIASQNDLGTATPLWNQPGKYAAYLQLELSALYGGQVLVVMPQGPFGLHGPYGGPHSVTAGEESVRAPAPGPGEQLVDSAIAAVPLLARADGHPIPAAAIAAADRSSALGERAGASTFSPAAIVALVTGVLLIAVAWVLSVRARPLHLRRGLQP